MNGGGIVRLFSYHIADELGASTLQLVLTGAEGAPLPAHLLAPQGRLQGPTARALTDFAVPRLRRFFQRSASNLPQDLALNAERTLSADA